MSHPPQRRRVHAPPGVARMTIAIMCHALTAVLLLPGALLLYQFLRYPSDSDRTFPHVRGPLSPAQFLALMVGLLAAAPCSGAALGLLSWFWAKSSWTRWLVVACCSLATTALLLVLGGYWVADHFELTI